jgi:hypothetical protein
MNAKNFFSSVKEIALKKSGVDCRMLRANLTSYTTAGVHNVSLQGLSYLNRKKSVFSV